jgi:hypothetical protein
MKNKEQVVFDIRAEEFKYLYRDEDKIKNKVNIDVLNKRLNEVKKNNTYTNIKMVTFTLFVIIFISLISLKI